MVTVGLSVIAALLGYVGLTYYLNERPEYAGAEPFDRVYYSLQLFILSPTPLGGPPYGPMLSIAMYLAPLTTVLAVLQAVSAVYVAGELPDGATMPLFAALPAALRRIRYRLGLRHIPSQPQRLPDLHPAQRIPRWHTTRSPRLRLRPLPQRRRGLAIPERTGAPTS
jgi:hypothetical protein